MNVAGQSVMWLVRAPGCPLRIIKAQNRDEKKEANPIAAAEVRRVYLEKAFAKRSTEVGNDPDLQWPVFHPITEHDIQTMSLQWLTEESGVTGQPRGVCIVWQGPEKATVLKG